MKFNKQLWIPLGLVSGTAAWCVFPAAPRTNFDDGPKAVKISKWESPPTQDSATPPALQSFFAAAYIPKLNEVEDGEEAPPQESVPLPFLNGSSLDDRLTLQGTGKIRDRGWAIINGKLYQTGDSISLDTPGQVSAVVDEVRTNQVVMRVQGVTTILPLALSSSQTKAKDLDPNKLRRSDLP